MTYKEQLRTSAWLRKKYEIMARDNFVCHECLADNFESQLQVHHVAYIKGKKAWEYNDYMLVTLCKECHKKEHRLFKPYLPTAVITWITKLIYPKIQDKSDKKAHANF